MFGLLVLTFDIFNSGTVGSTVKIISAFPSTEYSESLTVGDSASGVSSIILPEGAKRTSRNSGF
jgi:hypothetical protein